MHKITTHRTKLFALAVCVLLSAFCLLPETLAQEVGGVKGKIRNQRGDAIAGAEVTARQNSKDIRTTKSNPKGEFVLDGLEAGVYNIVFDAKGYASGLKYNVEVKKKKTVDLGSNLILMVDQGSRIIIRGSVFYKDGTSVTAAKVDVVRVDADGTTRKIGTVYTNYLGEFAFTQPESDAKFRVTVTYKGSTATKEVDVTSAAIYRVALSLNINRDAK